jgi:hypothetical protein
MNFGLQKQGLIGKREIKIREERAKREGKKKGGIRRNQKEFGGECASWLNIISPVSIIKNEKLHNTIEFKINQNWKLRKKKLTDLSRN